MTLTIDDINYLLELVHEDRASVLRAQDKLAALAGHALTPAIEARMDTSVAWRGLVAARLQVLRQEKVMAERKGEGDDPS